MNASIAHNIEHFSNALVRMSAPRLIDDTRIPALRPPMKPATATIAEILAAKSAAKGVN
ncbi:MAG: hypothetical protein KGL39_55615 [Patescibacteria group bacterium]|nr:hypothetical protein [Patescibacteria group bacterium]